MFAGAARELTRTPSLRPHVLSLRPHTHRERYGLTEERAFRIGVYRGRAYVRGYDFRERQIERKRALFQDSILAAPRTSLNRIIPAIAHTKRAPNKVGKCAISAGAFCTLLRDFNEPGRERTPENNLVMLVIPSIALIEAPPAIRLRQISTTSSGLA